MSVVVAERAQVSASIFRAQSGLFSKSVNYLLEHDALSWPQIPFPRLDLRPLLMIFLINLNLHLLEPMFCQAILHMGWFIQRQRFGGSIALTHKKGASCVSRLWSHVSVPCSSTLRCVLARIEVRLTVK